MSKALEVVVSQIPGVLVPWVSEYFELLPRSTFLEPYISRSAKLSSVVAALVAVAALARYVWFTQMSARVRWVSIAAAIIAFIAGIACGLGYTWLLDSYYIDPPDIGRARVFLTVLYSAAFFGVSAAIATLVLVAVIELRKWP